MAQSKEHTPSSFLNEYAQNELSLVRKIYEAHVGGFDQYVSINPLAQNALMIALVAHEEHTRNGKDVPYINHPYESATLVWLHTKDTAHDEKLVQETVATAFLHDVLEMNLSYTPRRLQILLELSGVTKQVRDISLEDAQRVVYNVQRLTPQAKKAQETVRQWKLRKIAEAGRLLCSKDLVVTIVKAADIVANAKETLRDRLANGSVEDVSSPYSFQDRLFVFRGRAAILEKKAQSDAFLLPFAQELQSTLRQLQELDH